ncbi:DUF386 domain-containing protein [Pseudoflavonifractor sp. 524-17]|uniref:YhcH/YjgK/YiaL family protein n=1 Tax=Pseudoflavonifractor sp. 524-17 TaxID=2304577 RepID=UPI00137A63D1|nr:YhcH/YjgK/YiaL family protein [Pseudoflavonifractor sp. 524-17]NCE64198.1 DUF386 domain-containing protein [Pseudoflavonifractor sp. 524-17]
MVFDRIENAPLYYGLGPRFQKALEWMAQADPTQMKPGEKVVIDGNNVFATLFKVDTLPRAESQLEGHRNYADIQYVLNGQECVGYALEGTVPVTVPFDPEKDIGFWNGDWDTITVRAGNFYIVWPQDLHAPRVASGTPEPVTRLVVKVKLN